ncbi:PhzF family phenazine biosynthesis protein, partial [Hansschlegelia zhihuaiae]|uniref:PhzF family phenazine biosynthesis protein n=1 Tax=Hansschlegelia zhihuaiae TaxID=405005 RepID=UPI001FE0BA7E
LSEADIGFDGHVPSRFDAGNAFTLVPVTGLDALGRARPDAARWAEAISDRGAFLYTRETGDPTLAFRARMLRPDASEDPATGSAVASFAGALAAFERPADGRHAFAIGQGFEMQRPSVIELGLEVAGGALVSATIGGAAVVTAEGTLFLA